MKIKVSTFSIVILVLTILSGLTPAQSPGNALDFDGSNDYVSVPDAAALDITDQITIEGWFKPSASSWTYKKLITVDKDKVLATQSNFPVLVSVTDTDLLDSGNGGSIQPDGDDILFRSTDGSKLSHEIELYDGSTGKLIAWVKIPTLSSVTDTKFYLYYGNSSCSSQQDAPGVWSANFKGVWHMDENVTNEETTGTHYESSNGHNGTQNENARGNGQIGYGQDFDGAYSSDYIDVPDHDDFTFIGGGTDQAFSLSAWIQGETNRAVIIAKDNSASEWDFYLHSDGRVGFELYDPAWDQIGQESIASVTGGWQYVTATYDGSETSAGIKIYIDGVEQSLNLKQFGTYDGMVNTNDNVEIGAYDGANNEYDWDGLLDEVRISSVALDSSWIATEFNNQDSPGTFLSLGNEALAGFSKWGAYALGTDNTNAYASINDQVLSGSINAGEWNHIAITYNKDAGGTDEMKLYINGTETATGDYSTAITSNSSDLILGDMSGFIGMMDEVRLWNDVRTEQELRENMHRVVTPGSEANLVGYWQVNSSSGTSATDSKGSNTGTLTNMTDGDWVTSSAPFGGGLVNSEASFTSGTTSLGNFSMTTTDAFDNAVDLTSTEISNSPDELPAAANPLKDRYWVVNEFGTPGTYAGNVTFTLPAGYLDLGDEANLKLYYRDSNSDGGWSLLVDGAALITETTVTFNGVSSLGQFSLAGSGSFPMPVELISFTASVRGSMVNLYWATATEVNNYGFEVERSVSDGVWDVVGFVEGHGNSNSPKEYEFSDDLSELTFNTQAELVEYRLKQLDLDGEFEYYHLGEEIDISGITSIEDGLYPVEYKLSQNYPNPFNPSTTINFALPVSGHALLEIYNSVGQKVATLVDGNISAGHHEVVWDAGSMSSGFYVYKIMIGNYADMKKMVLVK